MSWLKRITAVFLILNSVNIALFYAAAKDPFMENIRPRFEMAIKTHNAADIKRYLDEGFDVNSGDYLAEAASTGKVDLVNVMLKAGARVNEVRYHPQNAGFLMESPLLRATYFPEVVKVLIAAGADLNVTDREGSTTLIRSLIRSPRYRSIETAKLLIDAGADVNIVNRNGDNALLMADDPEIIKLLLSHGANPNTKDKSGKKIPFFSAVETKNIELINAFIDAGVDINIRDSDGKSALFVLFEKISQASHPSQMDSIIATSKRLLEAGIDTNIKDISGRTIHYWAIKPEIKALLSQYTASPKETKTVSLNRSLEFSNHSEGLVVLNISKAPNVFERKQVLPYEDVAAVTLSTALSVYIDTKSGMFLLQNSADGQSFNVYKLEATGTGQTNWKEHRKDIQQLPVDQAEKVVVIINPDGSITVAQRQ